MPEPANPHKSIPVWLVIVIVCAAIAGAGNVIFWQTRMISSLQAQLAGRTGENAELQRRLDQLTRAQAEHAPVAPKASAPRLAAPEAGTGAAEALSAAEQRAERLRESLSQATAEITRLQARVSDIQTQLETAAADNRGLTAAAEASKKGLVEAEQAVETARAELKTNNARIAQLENSNAKFKEDAAAAKQSTGPTQQIISDLEGIFRRRETFLNNILRRYREITEQYRALSGVMDSQRDRGAATGAAEISRIQNSIALTEDDLKQISALNAQASRLERKLPAR
jgi:chromosome segregation ATPase